MFLHLVLVIRVHMLQNNPGMPGPAGTYDVVATVFIFGFVSQVCLTLTVYWVSYRSTSFT